MSPCGELAGASLVVGAWRMQWWAVLVAMGRWAPGDGADQRWEGPTVALGGGASAVGRMNGGPRWQWRTGGGASAVGHRWTTAWRASVVDRRGGALADSGVAVSGSTEWVDDAFEKGPV